MKPFYKTVIAGGGPAGTGILMYAAKAGQLDALLRSEILITEKSERLVAGNLPAYHVNSDTFADVFLECLDGDAKIIFGRKLESEIAAFRKYSGGSIPLDRTRNYLSSLGEELKNYIAKSASEVMTETIITKAEKIGDEHFRVTFSDGRQSTCNYLVLACGASQHLPGEFISRSAKFDLTAYNSKTISSDSFLRSFHDDRFNSIIEENKEIVILGGSHSAFSAAWYALDHVRSKKIKVTIIANQLPKVYFPNVDDARMHGYADFSQKDICPLTGKVYRLAGLRMDGRELYMKMSGLLKEKEDRVKLIIASQQPETVRALLENSGLVISALGYEFNMPPFHNEHGQKINFAGERTRHWCDGECRLILDSGEILSNCFITGLASGFIPSGKLGGEEGFTGITNGLWYYQNSIGKIIFDQLMK